MDVIFAVATFNIEGPVLNIAEFRTFVIETVRNLGDLNTVRVGVVFFSNRVTIPIMLGAHNNTESFSTALNNADENQAAGNFVVLAEGIEAAVGQLSGGRQDARKVIVVVSGRTTENIDHSVETANSAKRQRIEIIGAGFGGDAVRNELSRIATELADDHVFTSASATALQTLARPVNETVCTGE